MAYGDNISRRAAIGALRNYLVGKNVPCDGTLTCRLIENEVINKLPSAQLGTNLAELGTDCISRQAAIDALYSVDEYNARSVKAIKELPSAQPEIMRCCECKYLQCNMRPDGYLPKSVDEFECRHWCGSCDPMDFCSYAERREVTE